MITLGTYLSWLEYIIIYNLWDRLLYFIFYIPIIKCWELKFVTKSKCKFNNYDKYKKMHLRTKPHHIFVREVTIYVSGYVGVTN